MDLTNFYVTPIQNLSEDLNNNAFYIKRDDLLPISFGGNKARKALLFFEDILQKKADCVVTYGSSSSNHCRIIANIAAAKGIPCHIISPTESSFPTANSKLIKLLGAFVITCSVSQVNETIEKTMKELTLQGYKPYFIQGGGHGNIGTQAYVKAYEEILEYEKVSGNNFDYIFHTTGTGTTQAGLICGGIINANNKEIIGISNARKNPYGKQVVYESVNSYLLANEKAPINPEIIKFIDDYVLEGYGTFNDEIVQTIKDVLINDGVPMDTTYTGKAFWGMKQYVKKNNISNKKILFIHTGGTPLFFDKLEDLNEER